MRVAIDGREMLRDRVTGIGRFVRNILAALPSLAFRGEVVLLANQHTETGTVGGPVRVVRFPEWNRLWWDQVTVIQAMRTERADLYFSPYYKVPLAGRFPAVITIHDVIPILGAEVGAPARWRDTVALRVAMAACIRRAAVVVTVSERSKEDLIRVLGVPEAKLRVVYHGVESRFVTRRDAPEERARVRAKYELPATYLLTVGNFLPHKNLESLVQAYAGLPARVRALTALVLAGSEDTGTASVREAVRRAGVEGSVHFPGYVEEADLPFLYTGATALLFPSRYEGFGLPALEAMACGCPMVSSGAGALQEVIGGAGVLVPCENVGAWTEALQRITGDEALRRSLRDQGLARARQFPLRASVERLVGVFTEVVAQRGARWRPVRREPVPIHEPAEAAGARSGWRRAAGLLLGMWIAVVCVVFFWQFAASVIERQQVEWPWVTAWRVTAAGDHQP